MMKLKRIWISGLAATVMALVLLGCNDSATDLNKPAEDIGGVWLYSDTANTQATWALVQSDDGTIDGAGTDGANITGLLSADEIHLSLTYSGGTSSTLDGTVATNVMTGAYTNSVSESGTWSAVKTN